MANSRKQSTNRHLPAGARRRQSGAAAVEFAIVFPLLFALMYGTIVYGYVFFAQQTINLVAQESAKAAIAAATPFNSDGTPETADYAGAAQAYFAQAKTQGLLQYLPGTATLTSNGLTSVSGGTGQAFTVTVSLTGLSGPGGAFPTISLNIMGLGDVPPLPSTLSASATVRVS